MKGKTDRDLMAEEVESTKISRPSLFNGNRIDKRFLEKIAAIIHRLADMLSVSRFKNLHNFDSLLVILTIVHVATFSSQRICIYKTEEIKKIA